MIAYRSAYLSAPTPTLSSILDPRASLLLRGLGSFSGYEEFVDSILVDFDLAPIFVPFAGGLDESVVGQALTVAEDALAKALALLREF
jgi:hypothetical protein